MTNSFTTATEIFFLRDEENPEIFTEIYVREEISVDVAHNLIDGLLPVDEAGDFEDKYTIEGGLLIIYRFVDNENEVPYL